MGMTRQEQLDAVVRNYGEWPKQPYLKFAVWNKPESRVCFFNQSYASQLDEPAFTRAEVEQRKAELQNKPSFEYCRHIMPSVKYIAQSRHGEWAAFDKEPRLGLTKFNSVMPYNFTHICNGEVIGDWRDTLEKRPVAGDQPAPEEEEAFNMLESRNGECIGGDSEEFKNGDGLEVLTRHGWRKGYYVGKIHEHPSECEHGVYVEKIGLAVVTTNDMRKPIKSDREKFVEAFKDWFIEVKDDYRLPDNYEVVAGIIYEAIKSGKLKLP